MTDEYYQPPLRELTLIQAADLITGERNQTYGSPTQNFQDTADVWNVLLRPQLKDGEKITPGQVASMMIALKLVRQIAQPKSDNWIDIAGYAGCGHEVDVETGRINEPREQVPWPTWNVGYTFHMEEDTEEPADSVKVLMDPNDTTGIPYLIRANNTWYWSGERDFVTTGYTSGPWSRIRSQYSGTWFTVVAPEGKDWDDMK